MISQSYAYNPVDTAGLSTERFQGTFGDHGRDSVKICGPVLGLIFLHTVQDKSANRSKKTKFVTPYGGPVGGATDRLKRLGPTKALLASTLMLPRRLKTLPTSS